MHLGTIGLGAVTAAVVGLTVVVVVALSPAPFAGAFDTGTEQPAHVSAARVFDTPTPSSGALDREQTAATQSSTADRTADTGLRSQSVVVSGFALVTLTLGALLALAHVRSRSGRRRHA